MSKDSQNDSANGPNTSANPDAAATENTGPEAQLQEARQAADKLKNDYLYLKAEFENYKRNAIKERSDLLKFAAERIVVDLLQVVDNFDRALATPPTAENLPNYQKGIDLTAKELKSVLQKHGVQEMNCEGEVFNPNFHEALSSEETSAVPEGHISRVFQKPYKLHDKLIRPAKVVVAKASTLN